MHVVLLLNIPKLYFSNIMYLFKATTVQTHIPDYVFTAIMSNLLAALVVLSVAYVVQGKPTKLSMMIPQLSHETAYKKTGRWLS